MLLVGTLCNEFAGIEGLTRYLKEFDLFMYI